MLILTNDEIIVLSITALWLIIWVILFRMVRRRFKNEIKQIDHQHKKDKAVLLDDDDIRWEELGIEYSERPFVKLQKKVK